MWKTDSTEQYNSRQNRYQKKPRTKPLFNAVAQNFTKYFESLQHGAHPRQKTFGFLHFEPAGVLAIDQRGGGANLAETRLYVYPDEDRKWLYLLTLGDKNSQSEDIQYCKEWVKRYNNTKETGAADEDRSVADKEREDDDG